MKLSFSIVLMFAFLVACSSDTTTMIEKSQNEGLKDLVHAYSVGEINDETASITATELIVTNSEEEETVYPLPEDEFFVSIAPYMEETHPCKNHSLTGCQGELINEKFAVYIEDAEGNVVMDETIQTQKNGFFDLWLPRNETYQITISQDGKKVESEFSTFPEDGTCITTLQLT